MATINQLSAIETPQAGDQLPLFSTNNGDARKMALSVLATWLSSGVLTDADISGFVRVAPVSVANLPNPVGNAGALAFVSDATNNNFHQVVAGGGANFVPVYSDGANWRIG